MRAARRHRILQERPCVLMSRLMMRRTFSTDRENHETLPSKKRTAGDEPVVCHGSDAKHGSFDSWDLTEVHHYSTNEMPPRSCQRARLQTSMTVEDGTAGLAEPSTRDALWLVGHLSAGARIYWPTGCQGMMRVADAGLGLWLWESDNCL